MASGLALGVAGLLLARPTPQTPVGSKTLVVNGKAVSGAILEMEGRSYVDVEALSKAMGGQVTIEPNRVVLNVSPASEGTTPVAEANAAGATPANAAATVPAAAAEAAAPPPPGELPDQMSRGFMATAIGELAAMREWRGVITVVIQYGIPVSGTWPQDYQDRVQAGLNQVNIAASNGADRDAAGLMQSEFSNLESWASGIISARQSLNGTTSLNANALQNDSALKKITACGDFLNGMIVSGTYSDDPSCH